MKGHGKGNSFCDKNFNLMLLKECPFNNLKNKL